MIYPELTEAQQKRSQWNFLGYNFANGMGYICVGDTVMMLLANRLGFPDWVFTTLSSLFGLGYLWLPLGKYLTGKWGAARTQSNFWFLRNIAAVLMASCAIWGILGHKITAGAFLLGGAFIFYGCRAAGSAMSTALVGNITTPEGRGKLMAFASMAHNIMTAVTFILLTLLLAWNKSLWVLYGVVVYGASCGVISAIFLRNIDETDAIQKAAQRPLWDESIALLKDYTFLRLLLCRICASIGMALTLGLNNLLLKRGFGLSDSLLLALNFMGSMVNVITVRPTTMFAEKFNPRLAVIVGYIFSFLVIGYWYLVPDQLPIGTGHTLSENVYSWGILFLLYLLTSIGSMSMGICQNLYFLKAVPVKHQPTALVLTSICDGVLTGFISMGITALIWKGCDSHLGTEITGMVRYRYFFRLALPVVFLCLGGVFALKKTESHPPYFKD